MGSYNKWCVTVDTDNQNTLSDIRRFGRNKDLDRVKTEPTWDDCVFQHWSLQMKWNPIELVKIISVEFPVNVFSVEYNGDFGVGRIFILNGKAINANDVWLTPPFPSVALVKKSFDVQAEREALKLKEMKDKIAAEKEAKIKSLEEELRKLKEEV